MRVTTVRRLVVAALVSGGLVLPAAGHADTTNLAYSCSLPVIGARPFQMQHQTNAPATAYFGKQYTPTLTTLATIPTDTATLMADGLGAAAVDGTLVQTVSINGADTAITQKVVRRSLPSDIDAPVVLTAAGAMPRLAPTAPGSRTYLPGDVTVTLNFYKASGSSAGSFANMTCTMAPTSQKIAKVAFAKSPSKISPTVGYSKSKKKATATAKVTATSGLVPTGKVTAVLLKGTKKVKSVTATLAGGKATAVFKRVKKSGSYKVVFTYAGSSANNGSTATKTFKVKK